MKTMKDSVVARPAKVPLPVLRTETGVRRCGHNDFFKILKGEIPDFAARRREKWASKLCPACSDLLQKEQQSKAVAASENPEHQSRRAAIRAAKAADGWKKRLPDGSRFTATYCADPVRWTGTLVVPGSPSVEGSAAGATRLLHNLAREWAKVHGAGAA